jgi:hypothetical protein
LEELRPNYRKEVDNIFEKELCDMLRNIFSSCATVF